MQVRTLFEQNRSSHYRALYPTRSPQHRLALHKTVRNIFLFAKRRKRHDNLKRVAIGSHDHQLHLALCYRLQHLVDPLPHLPQREQLLKHLQNLLSKFGISHRLRLQNPLGSLLLLLLLLLLSSSKNINKLLLFLLLLHLLYINYT